MFNKALPFSPNLKFLRSGQSSIDPSLSTLGSPGFGGAPEGSDHWEFVPISGLGFPYADGLTNMRFAPVNTSVDNFELLPATAAAAGNDWLALVFGTATVQVARAAKGGVNIKTKSSAAQNDIAALKPVANSGLIIPLRAAAVPRFSTRVNLTQVTGLLFSAGFDENVTDPDPTNTTGDGAKFVFDPSAAAAHANPLASSTYPNWLLFQKIAGTNYYSDTGIPVVANTEYDLAIQFDQNIVPHFYLNGVEIVWGAAAGGATSGYSTITPNTGVNPLNAVVGNKITAGSPGGPVDFDCRVIQVERTIG